jgi:hypothetical protein
VSEAKGRFKAILGQKGNQPGTGKTWNKKTWNKKKLTRET